MRLLGSGNALARSGRLTLDPGSAPALLGNGGGGGFAAAKINRLTMDFIGSMRSADAELWGDNRRLRARGRTLAVDNPFMAKFLAMVVQNVVGERGIQLQAKVTGINGKSTAATDVVNRRIEEEWKRWCRVGRCTADGRYSFAELQQVAIANCAREGENLVKHVYGRQFNDVGFALQPLDNDQLDDTMMQPAGANGDEVRMGVEVDQYRRPLAYHIFNGHPNDLIGKDRQRVRIPAAQIVHTALWKRPGQTRGYTWAAPSILSMNRYNGYETSVGVAAQASASKFMVVEQTLPDGYIDDGDDDGSGGSGGADTITANAGEALVLDPGQTANFIDPRFPTNNHREYTRTVLRNIASGLLVSYPSLANDLEGVNFSSIRAGLLDERDSWRILQRWFIDHFLQPIFDAWLRMALLTVLTDIALSAVQREQVIWRARGWDWVDPLKDSQAAVLDIANGFDTYENVLGERGLDVEEVFKTNAAERRLATGLGLELGTDIRGINDTANDDGTVSPTPTPPVSPKPAEPAQDKKDADEDDE